MIRVRRILRRIWLPVILRLWPLARLWYRLWGLRLTGKPGDEIWYFAYGANMNDAVFRGRRGMRPLDCRVGRVRGFRLRFNLEGRPKGRAAPANMEAAENQEVWGVLYRISRRDLVRLNASEGVPGRRYVSICLEAEDAEGRISDAHCLIAAGMDEDGAPSRRYLDLLRAGARAHGLPDAWIAKLDNVKSASGVDAGE